MKHALWRVFTQRQTSFIGISHDDPRITDSDRLRYEACITIRATVKPKGDVGIQILKGGAYAVFLHRGTYERFSETYDRIFAEWLPASGYSLRNIPHFERYLNRNPKRTKPENMRTELFIPLFQIGKACIST
jgi:AraC family transcriptional regulator